MGRMDAHADERLADAIERMPLVDHHVHGMLGEPLPERDLLDAMVQADHAVDRAAVFDSQFGFALRRHCAPVLGLEPFADGAAYFAARSELGFDEATRRPRERGRPTTVSPVPARGRCGTRRSS